MMMSPADTQAITAATGQAPVQHSDGNWYLPNGDRLINLWGGWSTRTPGSSTGMGLTGVNAGKPQTYGLASTGAALKQGLPILGGLVTGASLIGGLGAGGAAAGAGGSGGAGQVTQDLSVGDMNGNIMDPGSTPTPVGGVPGQSMVPTGGAGSMPSILSKLGSSLTALNSGAASGRQAETKANQDQYKTQLSGVDAQLNRAALASELQKADYKRQVVGGLLQGMQDTTITPPANIASHMATVSGGARPSAITGASGIGSNMANTAALDLLQKGDPNTGYTGVTGAMMPTLPALPTPNGAQSALGYLGPGLNLGGQLDSLIQAYKARNNPVPSLAGG